MKDVRRKRIGHSNYQGHSGTHHLKGQVLPVGITRQPKVHRHHVHPKARCQK